MGKYFGTDGFRGEAGVVLTAEHAFRIGRFLGWYYGRERERVSVVIGKDTRRSGYLFEYAIAAGLTASGADAYMLHVTTTPSVSHAVALGEFSCGVMISASHNPFYDNGIKLVNDRGEKLGDEVTDAVEAYLERASDGRAEELPHAKGEALGRIIDYAEGRNRYIGYLISLSGYSFRPFRVGLDCANGSAWMIAKAVFEALGAQVCVINAQPDGLNINKDAGSTHVEGLAALVRGEGLDVGFAFDGDADRCIAVDERGEVVNGDHILYLLATEMKRRGELVNNTVVTTVMSNLGLYRALEAEGIRWEQTAVGDRFVYENMLQTGNCIGGEQSGHVILSKYATTGDGILTAIKVMETMIRRKQPLSRLAEPVRMYPQVLINLRVEDRDAVMRDTEVSALLKRIEERLGNQGRILLRRSGTEPVVRVMTEAESETLCRECAEELAELICRRYGGEVAK
ncbi:MAG: phosphoglucosamine mutase [Ruminococcaceae bacterium]|nr:phosphoglucosamine mutase [Oscillospiraceae bacterium]